MEIFLLAFFLPAVLTMLCVVIVRRIALAARTLDTPGTLPRKQHERPVPLMGGVALYSGFALSAAMLAFAVPWFLKGYFLPKYFIGLLLGGALLIIGGVLDDRFRLSAGRQFVFPLIASLLVIASGVGITYLSNPFGEAIRLDVIKIPLFTWHGLPYFFVVFADLFTLVWVLGMTYTTKLLDGLDGLVAGITVIAGIVLAIVSMRPNVAQPESALLFLMIAGAAAGFLMWNFYPAKIFLGEGGSTLPGFLLGTLAIVSGSKVATALILLGVPIVDILFAIIRRIRRHASPFAGDRGHLHFGLLEAGLKHRDAVLFLYAVTLAFGLVALFTEGKIKILALIGVAGVTLLLTFFMNARKRTSRP